MYWYCAQVPDRDLRSAKKAKLIPKATIGSENGFVICEDANMVCEGEVPSAQKMRSSDELTSNKENQSDVASKVGGQGKEKKKVIPPLPNFLTSLPVSLSFSLFLSDHLLDTSSTPFDQHKLRLLKLRYWALM